MCNHGFAIMRRRLSLGLALTAVLLASGCNPDGQDSSHSDSNSAQTASSATSSSGTPPARSSTPPAASSSSAGILDASWVAPTTNADGSPLTDLAFYRLYFGAASAPCPGSAFFQIASPTSSPQIDEIVTYGVTGLLAGARYFASVTAVDSSGLESACSPVASAIARSNGGSAAGMVGSIANIGTYRGGPVAIQGPVSTLTGLTADLWPQLPGATVTFTAMAAGGTAPYQFKWWLWDGATWTLLEDWSIGNTFAWTPSTPNPNFVVGVWVRSAGNTADQPDGYPANTGAYGSIPVAIN
jgi:hypothetical protein